MANLGNIGNFIGNDNPLAAWQFFTRNKQPTGVIMSGVSDVPYAYIVLTRNSKVNYVTRANALGEWHFYDMDDSLSQDYAIAAYTQAGATGEAWTATVVGSTATVVKRFSSQRASAHAFT